MAVYVVDNTTSVGRNYTTRGDVTSSTVTSGRWRL